MTSLDMQGFSVSLLPLDEAVEEALDAPVAPWAWPPCVRVGDVPVIPMPDGMEPDRAPTSDDPAARDLLARCCALLREAEADLNALDAKSGDGDTGSTLAGAAKALEASLDRLPLADRKALLGAIGQELGQTMGGSSGVLLAIFFSAAGDADDGAMPLAECLKAGLDRVQAVGGAQPGDRTMIDALAPALSAFPQGLKAAAQAARQGADRTAAITRAKAGRSAYVSADQLAGHNDPGAEAVARLFEGLAAG